MTSARPSVVVAIATYRRPESVIRLLDHAVDQHWSARAEIIVLDNDPAQSGAQVRAHPALGDTGYLHVPQPGVVAVRNAALDQAAAREADYLIFIDDDMTPLPGWYDALLDTAQTMRADIVQGRIVQPPAVLAKPYARAALGRLTTRQTGLFDGDVSSGNLLLGGAFLRNHGLRFDHQFNGMGGEDTHFGRQAAALGAVLAYSHEATTMEHNSPADITVRSLLHRSFNNGRSLTTINRTMGARERLPLRLARWSAATPWSLARACGATVTGRPDDVWRHIFSVARHTGRLRSGTGDSEAHYRGIGAVDEPADTRGDHEMTVRIGPFAVIDQAQRDVVERLATMATADTVRTAYALHVGGLNARHNTAYVHALSRGDLVYADGMAVVLLARLAGARVIERAPTTDIGWQVLARHAAVTGRPSRVALVGGPEGLAERAGGALEQDACVEVVMARSGYTSDWPAVLASLRDARPDITFLGLGSPFEVTFCEAHHEDLPRGLVMTCGGWFGFLAAEERRAPGLLQRAGLEWVSRVAQSPRRLAPRYAKGVLSSARIGLAVLGNRVRRRVGR